MRVGPSGMGSVPLIKETSESALTPFTWKDMGEGWLSVGQKQPSPDSRSADTLISDFSAPRTGRNQCCS